jgi:hypothetical protein
VSLRTALIFKQDFSSRHCIARRCLRLTARAV